MLHLGPYIIIIGYYGLHTHLTRILKSPQSINKTSSSGHAETTVRFNQDALQIQSDYMETFNVLHDSLNFFIDFQNPRRAILFVSSAVGVHILVYFFVPRHVVWTFVGMVILLHHTRAIRIPLHHLRILASHSNSRRD